MWDPAFSEGKGNVQSGQACRTVDCGLVLSQAHYCGEEPGEIQTGLMIPSPLWHDGKVMRSLSSSLKAFWPVRDGRNCCQIVSSRGLKRSSRLGMVLERCVHLCIRPRVKAAYAACGWEMAKEERCSTSLTQPAIFSEHNFGWRQVCQLLFQDAVSLPQKLPHQFPQKVLLPLPGCFRWLWARSW